MKVKSIVKKMLALSLVVVLSTNFNGVASMAQTFDGDAEYRLILDEINEEYGVNIGFVSVNASEVSLIEYENAARKLAVQQKQLYNMIESRLEYQVVVDGSERDGLRSTKTKDSDVWNWEGVAYITATYDVNGTRISNPRGISEHIKLTSMLLGITYVPYSGYPTTNIVDSGRTLTVTYRGTYFDGVGDTFSNVLFYTEFYYNS